MYQGEFVEKVLAGALSEPDIIAYIKSQPKEDLPGLLTFIHDRQGAIIAEGMFKDRGDYFNLQWRDDFNKLCAVAELVKESIGGNISHKLPEELDTEIARYYFDKAIEKGWMTKEYKWLLGKEFCACFAVDMNKILWGITPGDKYEKSAKRMKYNPFTKLFGLKVGDLGSSYNDVRKAGQCKEYEERRKEVFGNTTE